MRQSLWVRRVVLSWYPGPTPSARPPQELRSTTWDPSPQELFSASASLSVSLSFQIPLSASRWLFLFPSPLPSQSGTRPSCRCQVGQAHMLLAGQASPGACGAGRQLWGLCSEWLLSPVLRTGQIQLTCRDSWLSLQMHPAGNGEMDTSPHRRPFHLAYLVPRPLVTKHPPY